MNIDFDDLEDKGENDPALDDFKLAIKRFAGISKKSIKNLLKVRNFRLSIGLV